MSRAEEMRELFARWEESGQSLRAFGKAEGVSYTKLQYWRRKFREDRADSGSSKTEKSSESSKWTEVRLVADAAPARTEGYEVWLANGISLDVRPGFDASELRRLVEALAAC